MLINCILNHLNSNFQRTSCVSPPFLLLPACRLSTFSTLLSPHPPAHPLFPTCSAVYLSGMMPAATISHWLRCSAALSLHCYFFNSCPDNDLFDYFEEASQCVSHQQSCVDAAACVQKRHCLQIYVGITHLKASLFPFTLFLSSNYFLLGGRHCFYGDVRDESRAPIGCRLSPMRPPPRGADSPWVWWMRGVSVFVYVCECRGGHRSVERPRGLALQSNEPFQKGGGETPSTGVVTHTHTRTQGWKEKGPDMMTTSPRRERVRLVCWAMSPR